MSTRVRAPTDVAIVPRRMDFAFAASTPKYWFARDPWSTHLFNALSVTFPAGERGFIESVRVVRDQLRDPALLEDVRGFIAQESHHRREHDVFNQWLRTLGVPVDEIYAEVEQRVDEKQGTLPHKTRLAVTCALEHFTAIMADMLLTNPDLFEDMDENVKWLWVWHAIEETEHKAVAFDVYEAIGGSYRTRALTMAVISGQFIWDVSRHHRHLLRVDGQLFNAASYARFMWRFWGPKGHFTKLLPLYLDYYRRDFHPWQHDNRAAVDAWKREVEARASKVGSREPARATS